MMIKSINSFLNLFGIQLKSKNALLRERAYLDAMYNGAVEIFNVHKKYRHLQLNDQIEGMVFSKDRAMQLHALLRSYIKNVSNYAPLAILYKTTSNKSQKAYINLIDEFKSYPIVFIKENDFYYQVKSWLSSNGSDRIFFITDDAIFLDSFDMKDALFFNPLDSIFSLTKGYDITYCFTHDVKQEIPEFTKKNYRGGHDFNFWKWSSTPASPDWSYPISVDGNFYLREEMLQMVKNVSFNNPNTLEGSLQIFIDFFWNREGVCFDKARLINIPCNLVQNDYNNRYTGFFSTNELQELWDKGERINIESFIKMEPYKALYAKYSFRNIHGK